MEPLRSLTIEELMELRDAISQMIEDEQRGAFKLHRRAMTLEEKFFFETFNLRVRNYGIRKLTPF